LSKYRGYTLCTDCNGSRLKEQGLNVFINNKNIADICSMTIENALQFFEELQLSDYEKNTAHLILQEIRRRLDYMVRIGIGYLALDRMTRTLSGGEAQRVKLAKELSKVGTGKTLYILDEPTTGLHFADIQKLLDMLSLLVDAGNSVVVIEHNLDVIKVADHVIDLGPEGGDNGGRIVAEGTPEKVAQIEGSYTGYYLRKVLNP